MENKYLIKKLKGETAIQWDSLVPAEILNYQWEKNEYCPKAYAKACYDERSINLQLSVYEKEIKAVYKDMNDPVCKDSCLECFIQPDPINDGRYLNFEFNSRGTLLLGLGSNREGRSLLGEEVLKYFDISVFDQIIGELHKWGVKFRIPIEFLREVYPGFELASGRLMKGNFYKCGDETKYPHYGSWNAIVSEKPDFHCPEYFGTWILE